MLIKTPWQTERKLNILLQRYHGLHKLRLMIAGEISKAKQEILFNQSLSVTEVKHE